MIFFLVFASYFVLDIVWAYYTHAIASKQPLRAAVWSMLIPIVAGYATIQFVHDPWLLVAAALGGFGGTYLATWWEL